MPSSQNPYSYLREEESDADSDTGDSPEDVPPDVDESATDLAFDDEEVGEALHHADEEILNAAPFGIIEIDDEGVVQFYNRYESNLSGVPPEEACGTNFFTELAPCSNNPLFWGRFKEGVEEGDLDEHFTYTFTYKMRPTLVDVRLYRDQAGNNWIMIQKR
jgi:photoactive yellow protein